MSSIPSITFNNGTHTHNYYNSNPALEQKLDTLIDLVHRLILSNEDKRIKITCVKREAPRTSPSPSRSPSPSSQQTYEEEDHDYTDDVDDVQIEMEQEAEAPSPDLDDVIETLQGELCEISQARSELRREDDLAIEAEKQKASISGKKQDKVAVDQKKARKVALKSAFNELNKQKANIDAKLHRKEEYTDDIFDDLV